MEMKSNKKATLSALSWNSALSRDECVETREYGPPSMKKLGKLGEATPRYAVAPSSNIWHISDIVGADISNE